MLNASLNVPHYRQEFRYSCVAASIRMVLAHYGVVHSEDDLRSLLGAANTAAPMRSVRKVSSLGFDVRMERATLQQLYAALSSGLPPIVFLQTEFLDYWSSDCSHVAVLVGMDATSIYLNDPFFDLAPQQASVTAFMQAWSWNHCYAAYITPLP